MRGLVLRDSDGTLMRPGSWTWTSDCETARTRATRVPPVVSDPGNPAAPQDAFGRFVDIESARHAVGVRAPQRGAVLQLWLDGSAGRRIVDLLQGGRVVRRYLLSNCPGARLLGGN